MDPSIRKPIRQHDEEKKKFGNSNKKPKKELKNESFLQQHYNFPKFHRINPAKY